MHKYNSEVILLTTVSVEKQQVLTISACSVLYCCLWPVQHYHIFLHYIIKGMI